ncbi:MAG: HAD family hydrolase [Gammaproteobacteria bacterium]|jgi:hypothetical protein|nr:HAD family hydrolase [Gammaproteobacteria bacterium]
MYIAMWSGPRNISTALMRAWENRNDTAVWDEPFYAYYLRATGIDHPGADEVIANGEPDWRKVVDKVIGAIPAGRTIFYQKHMTHHLLPEIDRDWLTRMTNCFLTRDPREVIASYAKVRTTLTVADVGIPQQAEIFEWVRSRTGQTPLVLDARDVLQDPHRMMAGLCAALDVPFTEHMLAWPPGPRESDGVWGKYWYASVWTSTGFTPYEPKVHTLPKYLEPLAEACAPHYRTLYECRLEL